MLFVLILYILGIKSRPGKIESKKKKCKNVKLLCGRKIGQGNMWESFEGLKLP